MKVFNNLNPTVKLLMDFSQVPRFSTFCEVYLAYYLLVLNFESRYFLKLSVIPEPNVYLGQFLLVIFRCFSNNLTKYHSEISLFCLLEEHSRSKMIFEAVFAGLECELGFDGEFLGLRVFLEIGGPLGFISWLGLTGLFEHSLEG